MPKIAHKEEPMSMSYLEMLTVAHVRNHRPPPVINLPTTQPYATHTYIYIYTCILHKYMYSPLPDGIALFFGGDEGGGGWVGCRG